MKTYRENNQKPRTGAVAHRLSDPVQTTAQLKKIRKAINDGSMNSAAIVQRVEVSQEEAGGLYDSLGSEKWREFIDQKDHEAALDEFRNEKIDHPGKYYDYQRGGDGLIKKSDAFKDFMIADAFTRSRIGRKVTADEYIHMHDLAYESGGNLNQGLRTDEVTWGLPGDATEKQRSNIRDKGLTVESGKGRYDVTAPMPPGGIKNRIKTLLENYYKSQEAAGSDIEKFENIINLYQQLEALHAFKDGTSRTNHLLLNKLLSEHGLGPAILREPNSPMFTKKAFGQEVLTGITHHQLLAKWTSSASMEKLGKLRAELVPQEKSELQIKLERQMGMYEEPKTNKFKAPKSDELMHTDRIDINNLKKAYEPKENPVHETILPPKIGVKPTSPKTLSTLDKILLTKVMGSKKTEETEKLYADQLRRFRDKHGY